MWPLCHDGLVNSQINIHNFTTQVVSNGQAMLSVGGLGLGVDGWLCSVVVGWTAGGDGSE